MSEGTVEAVCEKCGQTFTMFLNEMAARNLKVVCPRCAGEKARKPPTSEKKPA
jgi:DNA-directed RNA polymerase subunit RPC12/RpoP